ncbi:unnamed protein product [Prorocentrum cordatum]|uniref:Uncharacterized protein n=2 Tax=Prorocentrum cordatum TaxID=2364126 RepID=A0ABN9X1M0_9DINO|nr:unnamed protein product [Polarella glacialis]CAK0893154.1 unnamed protein product [Polarella glacialis]CAK0893156.1 unnamed protein product [Polarella glacialis]
MLGFLDPRGLFEGSHSSGACCNAQGLCEAARFPPAGACTADWWQSVVVDMRPLGHSSSLSRQGDRAPSDNVSCVHSALSASLCSKRPSPIKYTSVSSPAYMAPAMRSLLPAVLCCGAAGMSLLKPKKAPRQMPRALVATMVMPSDETPVDLMMEHHMRMISGNMSILEGAVIDNRPPWAEQPSAQEPLLSRYRRTQGSTGSVQVKSVDYSKLSALMARFFSAGDLQLNSKMLRLASHSARSQGLDPPANVSKLDEKANAARLLGMLNFLELCADADSEVDMCIFVDSTTFLYRENQTGLVEVAARLFRQDPMAVVLQPPDMCTHTRASKKGVCKVGNATNINHGFFVVNRDRFEGFAPMPVESAGLGSIFEEIFAEGLTKGGVEGAVKQIRCGGAFFIHPYDDSLGKYACPKQQTLGLPAHARATVSGARTKRMSDGHFDEDYSRFPGKAEGAAAVKSLIDRVEAGKFPEAKYPESVTNKCLNMCPSKERIRDGLAW